MNKVLRVLLSVAVTVAVVASVSFAINEIFKPGEEDTGYIGTSSYPWGNGYFDNMNVDTLDIDEKMVKPSQALTAADTLTVDDCGQFITLANSAGFNTTLPALSTITADCEFFFTAKIAPTTSYTIVAGNSKENKIFGSVVVNGAAVAAASEDTLTFAGGSATIGDWMRVKGDGTYWYLSGQGAAAGSLTATSAD